jgi:hypothetical protein
MGEERLARALPPSGTGQIVIFTFSVEPGRARRSALADEHSEGTCPVVSVGVDEVRRD